MPQIAGERPSRCSSRWRKNAPNFSSPHRYLAGIYLLTADYPHYLVEARTAAVLMHDKSALAIAEATEKGFAIGGGRGLLEALQQEEQKLYDRGSFSPFYLAQTYSSLGDKQAALKYLKIAVDRHADGVFEMESAHAFDNLHDEPAFRRIIADVGLPPIN